MNTTAIIDTYETIQFATDKLIQRNQAWRDENVLNLYAASLNLYEINEREDTVTLSFRFWYDVTRDFEYTSLTVTKAEFEAAYREASASE